ncbi:MAG: hypothetical protein IMW94_01835 [Thermoanaerobacter sp.]|nr:hypothetical protein [Thermoanaerobacter sp.]
MDNVFAHGTSIPPAQISRAYGPDPMQTIRHADGTGGSSRASMTSPAEGERQP